MVREAQIQTAIETLLRYKENQKKLVYIKNNSGAMQTRNGRYIRFGKKGSPDFLIFTDKGECIHCEVKTPKGRQNKAQKAYQEMIEALGHQYVIVRDLTDVEDLLK